MRTIDYVFSDAFFNAKLCEFRDVFIGDSPLRYNEAILSAEVQPGEVFKMVDNLQRKMLVVGTKLGNVIVFERTTDDPKKYYVQCNISFSALVLGFTTQELNYEQMEAILGDGALLLNVGKRLNVIEGFLKKLEAGEENISITESTTAQIAEK